MRPGSDARKACVEAIKAQLQWSCFGALRGPQQELQARICDDVGGGELGACHAPTAIPSVEHPLCGRMRGFDRLDDFEQFEFRVAEGERLALASVLMGGAELFGLGPCRKILLRRLYCMR